MTVPYTVESYVWIPRNQDVTPGSGTGYLSLAANAAWEFDTDAPELYPAKPGQTQLALFLPTWFPRKALLTRILGVVALGAAGTFELDVILDPQGIAYKSSPGGSETNRNFLHQNQMLVWDGGAGPGVYEQIVNLPVPVLFNRDRLDKLIVYASASALMTAIGVVFDFLVPNTYEPLPLSYTQ